MHAGMTMEAHHENTIRRTPSSITKEPSNLWRKFASFKNIFPRKTEITPDILFIAITYAAKVKERAVM